YLCFDASRVDGCAVRRCRPTTTYCVAPLPRRPCVDRRHHLRDDVLDERHELLRPVRRCAATTTTLVAGSAISVLISTIPVIVVAIVLVATGVDRELLHLDGRHRWRSIAEESARRRDRLDPVCLRGRQNLNAVAQCLRHP